MTEFDVLSEYASGLVRRIVRSALTPALWLCCFAPVCWGFSYIFSFRPRLEPLCIPLGVLGCVLVVPAIWGFVYFALKKPDKLQSEEYQLRQQVLAIIKKSAPEKIVDPGAMSGIVRPPVSPEPKDEP